MIQDQRVKSNAEAERERQRMDVNHRDEKRRLQARSLLAAVSPSSSAHAFSRAVAPL